MNAQALHIRYQTLRDRFRHSDDVPFPAVDVDARAKACSQLSRCILLRTPYQHDPHFERAFTHIDAA